MYQGEKFHTIPSVDGKIVALHGKKYEIGNISEEGFYSVHVGQRSYEVHPDGRVTELTTLTDVEVATEAQRAGARAALQAYLEKEDFLAIHAARDQKDFDETHPPDPSAKAA